MSSEYSLLHPQKMFYNSLPFLYLLFWTATFSMGAFTFQFPLNKRKVKLLLSFLVAETLAKIQSNEIIFKRKPRQYTFEHDYKNSKWRRESSFIQNLSRNKNAKCLIMHQTDLILSNGDFPSMPQGIVTGSDASWSHQNSKCVQSWAICVQRLPSP